MTQEHFVLIVSDEPEKAQLLARAIGQVILCHHVRIDSAMPAILPLVAVVDHATGKDAAAAWIKRLAFLKIPCLRVGGPPFRTGGSGGVLRVVASDAPRATILSAVFDLIDISMKSPLACVGATPTVAAKAQRACVMIADVFRAAKAGASLAIAEVDAGTEVILEAISDGGIRTWLETIGHYDEQLYQHSLSVAGYAAAFGFAMRLGRNDQMRLAKAALLHDVGKSRIPRAILNKPGKLTAEEMAVMRTHPTIGAELLARQDGFEPTMLSVVRHHHEMLDGSGYPDGLAGDEIPDMVRLVTICDIHSALTERRAYRDPLPQAEAHSIMQGMAGKLDGALLRAFLPVVRESAGDVTVR